MSVVDYERAVFQLDVSPSYGFLDDPEWGVDIHKEDCLCVLRLVDEVGYHSCKRSAIWDDMTGYVDEIQREEELPDGRFIVTYYMYDGQDLVQLADVDVSKDEVIQNVINQKYREGADYFLMKNKF